MSKGSRANAGINPKMFEGSHALQIADAVAVPCPDAVTVGFTQVAFTGSRFSKGGLGVKCGREQASAPGHVTAGLTEMNRRVRKTHGSNPITYWFSTTCRSCQSRKLLAGGMQIQAHNREFKSGKRRRP